VNDFILELAKRLLLKYSALALAFSEADTDDLRSMIL
jgi:hypothetical protein